MAGSVRYNKTFMQKKKKRKIISALVLSFGIMTSVIILYSADSADKNNEAPFVVAGEAINPRLDFFIQPLPNLTDEFTSKSIERLVKENEGKVSQGIKDPAQLTLLPKKGDVEKIVDDLIDKDLASEKVDISEISINTDNSKEMQTFYLLFTDHLLKENSEEIARINSSQEKSFNERASLISNKLSETAEMLKVVNVPPSWTEIHIQLVGFFVKQKNIYQALATAEYDPIRFLIAIKRLSGETEGSFSAIQDQINKKIKEEKLI